MCVCFFQWFVAPEGWKVGSLKWRVRSHWWKDTPSRRRRAKAFLCWPWTTSSSAKTNKDCRTFRCETRTPTCAGRRQFRRRELTHSRWTSYWTSWMRSAIGSWWWRATMNALSSRSRVQWRLHQRWTCAWGVQDGRQSSQWAGRGFRPWDQGSMPRHEERASGKAGYGSPRCTSSPHLACSARQLLDVPLPHQWPWWEDRVWAPERPKMAKASRDVRGANLVPPPQKLHRGCWRIGKQADVREIHRDTWQEWRHHGNDLWRGHQGQQCEKNDPTRALGSIGHGETERHSMEPQTKDGRRRGFPADPDRTSQGGGRWKAATRTSSERFRPEESVCEKEGCWRALHTRVSWVHSTASWSTGEVTQQWVQNVRRAETAWDRRREAKSGDRSEAEGRNRYRRQRADRLRGCAWRRRRNACAWCHWESSAGASRTFGSAVSVDEEIIWGGVSRGIKEGEGGWNKGPRNQEGLGPNAGRKDIQAAHGWDQTGSEKIQRCIKLKCKRFDGRTARESASYQRRGEHFAVTHHGKRPRRGGAGDRTVTHVDEWLKSGCGGDL